MSNNTKELKAISEWYYAQGFTDAAAECENFLRWQSPTQLRFLLARLHATEKMTKWQLFLATELEMSLRNGW